MNGPKTVSRKPSPKHGQLVDLLDQGNEFYVYGHVTQEECTAALAEWWEEDHLEDDAPPPALEEPRHRWARWVFSNAYIEDGQRELKIYMEPGRGRFKISAAKTVEYAAQRQADRDAREAARAHVAERWPGASIDGVLGGRRGASVYFSVPGVRKEGIRWRTDDPDHVWVAPIDRAAWDAYDASLASRGPDPDGCAPSVDNEASAVIVASAIPHNRPLTSKLE